MWPCSVLVPFLAVYTSYGLLDADIFRYRNIAAADVAFNRLDDGRGQRPLEGWGSTRSTSPS